MMFVTPAVASTTRQCTVRAGQLVGIQLVSAAERLFDVHVHQYSASSSSTASSRPATEAATPYPNLYAVGRVLPAVRKEATWLIRK